MAILDRSLLDSYMGKMIDDICEFQYWDAMDNHCAHFVSHVLQLGFGYTCGERRNIGYNVRVHEILQQCYEISLYPDELGCLVYVCRYITSRFRMPAPNRHIGIYYNGTIWHYNNKRDEVVVQNPDDFLREKDADYHQRNQLFFSPLPWSANPIRFGEGRTGLGRPA